MGDGPSGNGAASRQVAESSTPPSATHLVDCILPYQVLRDSPAFTRLALSHALAMPADWLYLVVVFALAYDETHSATVVGLLTLTRLLPPAVTAPFFGSLADRSNQKALLAGANLGRAACVLSLLAVHGSSALPVTFALVFVIAVLSGLYRPTLNAALPSIVTHRELLKANSVMSQVDMASYGVGPGLGSVFVLVARFDLALVVTAGLFLLATGALLTVELRQSYAERTTERQSRLARALEGFSFLVRQNGGVPAAFVAAIAGLNLLAGGYWAVAGALSLSALHLGSEGMGFLSAAYGCGGLLAGLAVGPIATTRSLTRVFIAAVLIGSAAAALFGLSVPGPLPFLWNGIMGAADVFSAVCTITVLQVATPGRLLGRVFEAYESTLILSMACGSVIVGPLVAATGPRTATVLLAAVGPASLLICLPWLVKLDAVLGLRLFLHRVPILATLSGQALKELSRRLDLERFVAGATVIREGDVGESLYLIKRGRVEIRKRGSPGEERVIGTEGESDYFGEIAFLRATPRTATVRAIDALEVYRLSRTDFNDMIAQSRDLRDALEGGLHRYVGIHTRVRLAR